MEISDTVVNAPPLDAASVVVLRDGARGLQALLLRRHDRSSVLGGAWVFPGGKVDASNSALATLALLDRTPRQMVPLLAEPDLTPETAAAIFVAAARQAFEEAGVLFAHARNGACGAIRTHERARRGFGALVGAPCVAVAHAKPGTLVAQGYATSARGDEPAF